jgi:hypothetical protein
MSVYSRFLFDVTNWWQKIYKLWLNFILLITMHTLDPDKATINDLVNSLVHRVVDDGNSQKILAVFPNKHHLNTHFSGIGFKPGDKYYITLHVKENDSISHLFTLEYLTSVDIIKTESSVTSHNGVLKEPENMKKQYFLDGEFFFESNDANNHDKSVSNLKISDVFGKEAFNNIALYKVEYENCRGQRELLYSAELNKPTTNFSKFGTTLENFKNNYRIMLVSFYSNEPSLARYNRSTVFPWVLLGTFMSIAPYTSDIISGVCNLVKYTGQHLMNYFK